MRSILVPTDFSETAANAVEYAAAFASHFNASLLLYHAYHVPLLVSEVPFTTTAENIQLEENSRQQLKLISEDIRTKFHGKVTVDVVVSPGLAANEIPTVAKENGCELIIMGTQGARNRSFWGSNSTQVVKNSHCDVLIIPDKVTFEPINKIAFAFDYLTVHNIAVYKTLIEIAEKFRSEILVFNIDDSTVHPVVEKQNQGILLEHLLQNSKHSYWFSEEKNIVDALNDFTRNNSAAMVSMIRREHTVFQFLFRQSNTKQMTLHTLFPLLVLHDKDEL